MNTCEKLLKCIALKIYKQDKFKVLWAYNFLSSCKSICLVFKYEKKRMFIAQKVSKLDHLRALRHNCHNKVFSHPKTV